MGNLGWVLLVVVSLFLLPRVLSGIHGGMFGGLVSAVAVFGCVWLVCKCAPAKQKPAAKPASVEVQPEDNSITKEE